jgi:S1-C subfamily serine protease
VIAPLADLFLALVVTAPQASPQPAPAAPRQNVEVLVDTPLRVEGPFRGDLDERQAKELQVSFARTAKSLSRNVVRLSIERAALGRAQAQFEVSAFVLGPQGQVVTFGNALDQASRVVVRFPNIPGARPRRGTVLGVDLENGVGLLDVGPVSVPDVKLDAAAPVDSNGPARQSEVALTNTAPARDPASRMVVSMWGVRGAENPIALGMMDGAQAVGGTWMYRISVVRRPEASGGIVARSDGKVVAMLLAPLEFAGASEAQLQPMLALPAAMLEAGIARVRAKAPTVAVAKPGPRIAPGLKPRAWIGVGASDLAEPEFLRQIDRSGAVVVEEVFEASPALAAGIEPHDLLLTWNGRDLRGVEDFSAALAASVPGSTVELECMRRLERRKVEVTLEAW